MIKIVYFADRQPWVDRGAFPQVWDAHGRRAMQYPEFFDKVCHYVQCDRITEIAAVCDYDGVGELGWPTVQTCHQAMTSPSLVGPVHEDGNATFNRNRWLVIGAQMKVTHEGPLGAAKIHVLLPATSSGDEVADVLTRDIAAGGPLSQAAQRIEVGQWIDIGLPLPAFARLLEFHFPSVSQIAAARSAIENTMAEKSLTISPAPADAKLVITCPRVMHMA